MELLAKYSDTVLNEIMRDIARSQRILDKARNREHQLHSESNVHQDNYWKTQRKIEVELDHIEQLFEELHQMDAETQWTDKLHQERYSFIHEKYSGIYEAYQFKFRS